MNEKMKNMENIEKTPVLDRPEFRRFVEDRDIKAEDFHLIEELAAFPKNLIVMQLHNLFNMYHERSEKQLKNLIKSTQDEQSGALYEVMMKFYRKYDWAVSWNLVRLLEEI